MPAKRIADDQQAAPTIPESAAALHAYWQPMLAQKEVDEYAMAEFAP